MPGTCMGLLKQPSIVVQTAKLFRLVFQFFFELFHFCEIAGILDQGSGVLVVFDETPVDKTYENTLELIHEMGKVVDALYSKAKKLQ